MAVRRPPGGWLRHLRVAALGVVALALCAPAYAESDPGLPPASVTKLPTTKSLEQLQAEAAAVQADFARATLGYQGALKAAQKAKAAADAADLRAASTRTRAAAEKSRLGRISAQAYQLGIPTAVGAQSMLWSLAGVAENLQEIADRQSAINVAGNNQVAAYQASLDAESAAGTAAADAITKRAAATSTAATAKRMADELQTKSATAGQKMQAWVDQLSLATSVSASQQKARNAAALLRWKTYLAELTTAGVKAPKAATLRNPAKLPAGLRPLKDGQGTVVRGAAQVTDGGRAVPVLSAETIRAVSNAFGLLGKPYGVAATGPADYGCLGAARAAWTPYTTLPRLVDRVYGQYQRVPVTSAQPGDLLLIGNDTVGLFHIGVALSGGEMIAADEARGSVIVTAVPANVYAVVRPTLGTPDAAQVAPVATKEAFAFRCGATSETYSTSAGGWTWPLPEGSYRIGTAFGQPGSLWATGVHTGQDFPAAVGTPVRAVTAGTAYVEHPGWAGNLVRIDHGDGIETRYAHLSATNVVSGQQVVAGQRIGAVGNEGNSTGPHLHFEVLLGGQPTNPLPYLATGGVSNGWGGFTNGMIPADKLCRTGSGGHLLRCDAARAFDAMAAAYQADLGKNLCLSDSYRSYASQVELYARKPSLAALPGTSNHGWGVATDLCGGVEKFGSREHQWLRTHAGRFGWIHPKWAKQGGSRPEPWHWEYGRPSAT